MAWVKRIRICLKANTGSQYIVVKVIPCLSNYFLFVSSSSSFFFSFFLNADNSILGTKQLFPSASEPRKHLCRGWWEKFEQVTQLISIWYLMKNASALEHPLLIG